MEKEYVRIQWENRPSIATPLGQSNLNKMDYQIDKNENTLITFDTTKANQSDLLQTIRTLTYDTETGIFVFTFWNGSTYSVDLNIEKIPVTFSMDEYGVITMTTADGTTYTCDIGALIKLYTFVDGDEIDFVTTTDAGGNKTITASIKDGSIVGSKLQPNFLADCQAAKAQAELAATNASSDASDAELSSEDSEAWAVGERNGQPVPSTDPAYENNAKWWAQHGTGSSFAGLTDTNFTNLQNGQIAKYNSTTQKWENTEDEGGLLPHFKITSEAGSTVTVVCPDTSVITPTQTSSGIWQCDVPAYGVYTVHAVINGDDAVRTVTVDTVKEYVIHDEHYSYTLNVYAPTGSSIIVTDGGDETYSGTGTGSTAVTFALHQASTTYTITVDYDLAEKIETITSSSTTGGSGSKTFEFGTINATVDNAFVGTDITCSLGGTVYTKTATTTSLTFHVPTTGTWVIAGEVSGTEFTVDANVVDLGTPVNVVLESIPEGTTVLPTDDIQTWLACANITNKSYTTLAEVLADTETYETLLADSNACQYMKRSTGWATIAVPTMTSDTTPEGECIASSYDSSNTLPYKAFDNDAETSNWPAMNQSSSGYYLGYNFESRTNIRKAKVKADSYSASYYYDLAVYGGDDLSNLTKISNTVRVQSASKVDLSFDISNDDEYLIYVIKCEATNAASMYVHGTTLLRIWTLQFYGGIVNDQDAMARLGKFDYAANKVLESSVWKEAIWNSDYRDYVMASQMPVMTSNTTPKGVASASSEYSSNLVFNFFNDNTNPWVGNTQINPNAWISGWAQYMFDQPVYLDYLKINIGIGGLRNTVVQYSNDGTTWTDICEVNTIDPIVYKIENRVQAKYIRLYIEQQCLTSWADRYPRANYLIAYGRASEEVLVPLVPTMTSATTPSGEVKSNVAAYSGNPYQVFDGNDNTSVYWTQTDNPYVEYDFASGHSYIVKRFMIYPCYSSQYGLYAKDYKIEASNDGATWTTLYTGTFTNSNVGKVYIDIENNTAYSRYRLYFTSETYANGKNWQIYELQFYAKTVQTNIIHSAPNDTIYILEDGDPIVLATTNSDGDGILDFSQLPAGPVTLYSSVAKDSDDLTADYSKTITITKTQYGGTTEAYLMPDAVKTLYWWGYEGNDLEEASTANGWTSFSGYAFVSPTYNTHYISVGPTSSNRVCAVGAKTNVVATKNKCIAVANGAVGLHSGYDKNIAHDNTTNVLLPSSLSLSEINGEYTVNIPWVGIVNTNYCYLYAFWYE